MRNRYYTDDGMEYVFGRLREEFNKRDITIELCAPYLRLDADGRATADVPAADFIVYWNKDAELCAALERTARCFNPSAALAVCDDKLKTYMALGGVARIPATLSAPLMYAASDETDEAFLSEVERLGFPLVCKERIGSRGEQVHLIRDRNALRAVYARLKRVPHLYESYIEHGDRDLRIYVVGGRAIGSVTRQGRGFKSNVYAGAAVTRAEPDGATVRLAERIADKLSLDYCAVDFVGDEPVLMEVNSNAYFAGAEQCGLDVAGALADHIAETVYAER